MFMIVSMNEGLSLSELSELASLKKSTASRYLLDMSEKTRAGGEGFGLISRDTDPMELRKNMYALSPQGRALVKKLSKVPAPTTAPDHNDEQGG
ncbi:MarR family winged helix-turn-helix transcriptional regulator [Novosphingobium clariflavum]|uniref:Helix-turn-helix domain-containing protein n=1 Tax=Novosphingobium clariflavum TaxID=2029884 RepID=A0ABV6SB64_9SPHN|nr:MarR family winged helix-turn-helix transcriptional regulator [Novosphingobium clariflavum]